MRYFVESVQTFSVMGKTAKGRKLQEIAVRYEHVLFIDDQALATLVTLFEKEVDRLNAEHTRSKALCCDWDPAHCSLAVKPVARTNDNLVFVIRYAPVEESMAASVVERYFKQKGGDR